MNNLFSTELELELFQNTEVSFYYFFRKYIKKTIKNIHYPASMNEYKSNMDHSEYESNLEICFDLPSEKSVLDCRVEKKLAAKIIGTSRCFEFHGVMLHAVYEMKYTKTDLL